MQISHTPKTMQQTPTTRSGADLGSKFVSLESARSNNFMMRKCRLEMNFQNLHKKSFFADLKIRFCKQLCATI